MKTAPGHPTAVWLEMIWNCIFFLSGIRYEYREALNSRKEHEPKNGAFGLVSAMGIGF